MNPRAIAIPDRMKHLPLDDRGYPIFEMIMKDATGKPVFTANNEMVRQRLLKDDCCPICNGKLLRGRWLVGGPLSAFNEFGAYIDPPMHDECVHYALKVCPYLAAPKWTSLGEFAKQQVAAADWSGLKPAFKDYSSQMPGRPKVFVAIFITGQTPVPYSQGVEALEGMTEFIRPKRPVKRIEYWDKGRRLDDAAGEALAREVLAEAEARGLLSAPTPR